MIDSSHSAFIVCCSCRSEDLSALPPPPSILSQVNAYVALKHFCFSDKSMGRLENVCHFRWWG